MLCAYCGTKLPKTAKYCSNCGRKQQSLQDGRRHLRRPTSQGTITLLTGRRKPYWARLPASYESGKAIRVSVGTFATYAEAAEALAKAMYLPSNNPDELTLKDLYERFISGNYFDQLSVSAQGSHKVAWKHLASCANIRVSCINKETFQRPIDTLSSEGLKRGTLAKIRNLASLLCKEAMGLGIMTVNYAQLVQLPRDDTSHPTPFSSSELRIIWDAADTGNKDAMTVLMLCYTGMRPSELLNVKIEEHIHHIGDVRYIQTGSKTEAGRNRIIPLPSIIHSITDILISERTSGPLIATPNGKHYRLDNWRPRCFNGLLDELGLAGHVPYSCRHTYADLIRRKNISPEIAMTILGHEDYSTAVECYHTITDEDISTICSAVEDLTRPQ